MCWYVLVARLLPDWDQIAALPHTPRTPLSCARGKVVVLYGCNEGERVSITSRLILPLLDCVARTQRQPSSSEHRSAAIPAPPACLASLDPP